jgi:Glycosyltransferase family 87
MTWALIRNRPMPARDPVRDGYIVAATLWCLAILLEIVDGASDARGWWAAPLPNPYVVTEYDLGQGFFFSPPVAFLFYPLTLVPWPVFAALWTAAMFATIYAFVGRWAFLALLIPPVWWEISSGNISLLVGLAVATGFRYPSAWAFVLLTKITPGVGLLWFLVRREWRNLAVAIGATAAFVCLTALLVPNLWLQWLGLMGDNAGSEGPGYFTIPVSLPVRLALAAILVTWGALTDRRWTVIAAAILGTPVLWYNALAGLLAVLALRHTWTIPARVADSAAPAAERAEPSIAWLD